MLISNVFTDSCILPAWVCLVFIIIIVAPSLIGIIWASTVCYSVNQLIISLRFRVAQLEELFDSISRKIESMERKPKIQDHERPAT